MYELMVGREAKDLLCVKIQSRHVSSRSYNVWIQYSSTNEGADAITGWYCTCPVGARLVGCCSHIAAVLWYLGIYLHSDKVCTPPQYPQVMDAKVLTESHSDPDMSDNE